MKKSQLKKIIREIIREQAATMAGPQLVDRSALEKYNRKAKASSDKYQRDRQSLAGMPVDQARTKADNLYDQFQDALQDAYDDFLTDIGIKDV